MITRKNYMEKSKDMHRIYFGQFVNEAVKSFILSRFTVEELHNAYITDTHLNSIALHHWDKLVGLDRKTDIEQWNRNGGNCVLKQIVNLKLLKLCGEGWSLSTATCIMKEAAKQIVEENVEKSISGVL